MTTEQCSQLGAAPQPAQPVIHPPIQPLDRWLKSVGLSSATGWRYRRRGWLECVVICGRPYVTAEAILKFIDRAKAGDFSKINHGEQFQ